MHVNTTSISNNHVSFSILLKEGIVGFFLGDGGGGAVAKHSDCNSSYMI